MGVTALCRCGVNPGQPTVTARPVIHRTRLAFKGGIVAWRVQVGHDWHLCFTVEEVLRWMPLCKILKHPKHSAALGASCRG